LHVLCFFVLTVTGKKKKIYFQFPWLLSQAFKNHLYFDFQEGKKIKGLTACGQLLFAGPW
jgi:hypothetical protein